MKTGRVFWSFLMLLALSSNAFSQNAADALVKLLGDPDPNIRGKAYADLSAMREEAREALKRGMSSPQPSIADSSRALWTRLPWTRPGDPESAGKLLARYGTSEPERRAQIITSLLQKKEDELLPIALRVATEDPSDEVAWTFARSAGREPKWIDLLAKQDPAKLRPALLYMLAMARVEEPRVAVPLLQQLMDRELDQPTAGRQEIGPVIDVLDQLVRTQADRLKLLSYRRYAISLAASDQASDFDLAQVLVLQSRHGPFPGLTDDVKAVEQLDEPEPSLAIAHLAGRFGGAISASLIRSAAIARLDSIEDENAKTSRLFAVGEYLLKLNDREQAIQLFAQLGDRDGADAGQMALSANLRLYPILSELGRHLEAAQRLEKAVAALDANANLIKTRRLKREEWPVKEAQAAVQWQYFKHFVQQKDAAAATKHGTALAKSESSDEGIFLDVVDDLRDRIAAPDFDAYANRIYEAAKLEMTTNPENVTAANDFAWICAKANIHLEEGLEHAQSAVKRAPNQSAYLDTMAELLYRLGRQPEALEIEKQALALTPDDEFMQKQVERFKTPMQQPATRPTTQPVSP